MTEWISPPVWAIGQLVTATHLNEILSGNLNHLFAPNYSSVSLDEADKTTTSTTFVDVDVAGDPDFSISQETFGEDLFIAMVAQVALANSGGNIAQAVLFDVTVDAVRNGSDDNMGYYKANSTQDGMAFPQFYLWRTSGLSVGTHVINLQWKVYAASGTTTATMFCGGATAGRDSHPRFFLWKA